MYTLQYGVLRSQINKPDFTYSYVFHYATSRTPNRQRILSEERVMMQARPHIAQSRAPFAAHALRAPTLRERDRSGRVITINAYQRRILRVCLLPLRQLRARLRAHPLPQLSVSDPHVSDSTLQLHPKTHGQHVLAKEALVCRPCHGLRGKRGARTVVRQYDALRAPNTKPCVSNTADLTAAARMLRMQREYFAPARRRGDVTNPRRVQCTRGALQ